MVDEISDEQIFGRIYGLRVTGEDENYVVRDEESEKPEGKTLPFFDTPIYDSVEDRISEVDDILRNDTTLIWSGSSLGHHWAGEELREYGSMVLYSPESLEGRVNLFRADRITDEDVDGFAVNDNTFLLEQDRYDETVDVVFASGYEPEHIDLKVPTQTEYEKELVEQLESLTEENEEVEEDREFVDLMRHTNKELDELLKKAEETSTENLNERRNQNQDDDYDVDVQ